jgi:hypothetical protein
MLATMLAIPPVMPARKPKAERQLAFLPAIHAE